MSVFVKICGLCSADAVADVAALKPDAIGFVFWPKSKRFVKAVDVAAWTRDLPPGILKVGVFVGASPRELAETATGAGLDVLQLHGFSEDGTPRADDVQCLEKAPWRIWQVVHLKSGATTGKGCERVDAYLLDSYSAESPGGTGQVCDWGVAREFVEHTAKPVLLAGGLTPENVGEAIGQVRPWGVDVSSGVEGSPGRKDIQKVKRFIEQCRNQ